MPYRVVVYETQLVSLIQAGEGARWIRSKAKAIEARARVLAPRRTGRLASSHVTLPTKGTNQYQNVWRVSAMAPYAVYVHEGVPKRIKPKKGRFLKVPVAPGANRFLLLKSVRGQKPQPWLEAAARDVGA